MMNNDYANQHISQHIEFLDIDTNTYTELNYIRSSMPIFMFPSHLELCLRHGLYLYDFSIYMIEEVSDIPRIRFSVCGDLKNMTAYKEETGTTNPTVEEIEQAILRDKNDPDFAEFFN